MQAALISTRNRLQTSKPSDRFFNINLHAVYQRAHGVMLGAMAILLCVQRTLSPEDATLPITATEICREILLASDDARIYRPVGAVWIVHALICAWCATRDPILKGKVENAILDFQRDAMGPRAVFPMCKLEILERRLCLLD